MSNTRLTRTVSSTTNTNVWTYSTWFKRANLGIEDQLLLGTFDSGSFEMIRFNSSNQLFLNLYDGTNEYQKITNQLFRDVSSWYNLVISRNGTTVNIYVNGVSVTSFATNNTYTTAGYFNTASRTVTVGGRSDNGNYFRGSMSHIHFIDGTVYDATAFGQYDANGVWTIKTSPSVTYGTNGFFILKNGNSVTDQSGNSNNFTVAGGTLTNTEDNPSNVFATFNATWNLSNGKNLTLTNGNTTTQSNSANWNGAISTIGVSTGKYYWEAKIVSATNNYNFGVVDPDVADVNNTDNIMNQVGYSGFYNFDGGETRIDGVVSTSNYGTFGNGDILGFALDKTNNQFSIYKNGAIIVTNASLGQGNGTVLPINLIYGTNQGGSNFNFGNGYFGTTAVSSAGTNASGIGIFEYDVPTGYTALSTKGLNL